MPRILYPAKLSFRIESDVFSKQAKAKGVHHYYTGLAENVKWTSLS